MRIALMSPLFESVPPKLYGGTERIVAGLCQGLTQLGHEVTLFASGDSTAPGRLVATVPEALRLSYAKPIEQNSLHFAQLADVLRNASDFDIIHNHNEAFGLPLTFIRDTPVVTTLHGRLDIPVTTKLLEAFNGTPLISISNAQRRPVPNVNWLTTIYHGIALDDFELHSSPGRYLAFLGRISPEKRPDLAIEMAYESGVPLKIAAKVDNEDKTYFEQVIKPRIDGRHIEFIGEIAEHEKSEFLGNALATLFPIEWPEPFGIAPVESWACGTPVLARPYGAVPEVHLDGVTGYVRQEATELAALIPNLEQFDRCGCRRYAEQNFSLLRMCEDYVDAYRQVSRRRQFAYGEESQTI